MSCETAEPACPFSKRQLVNIKTALDKQFQEDKMLAEFDGMLTCCVTGESVPFCDCGPHIFCSEHILNCIYGVPFEWETKMLPNDSLVTKFVKWKTRSMYEDSSK